MENGVEALKIAFGMLIFVLAITITISAFTSATQSLQTIFSAQEGEQYVKDAEGNYLDYVSFSGGTREVGVETIIPTMYRAYKENFAIYFYNSSGEQLMLYEIEKNGNTEGINYIDLQKEVHTSAEAAREHIDNILYKESDLYPEGLYENIKDKIFIEKLGEYYMDDLSEEGANIAEVNKVKKRVIAYTLKETI